MRYPFLFIGVILALLFASCEKKCAQEEPLVKLTFIDAASGVEYQPDFKTVNAEGYSRQLDLKSNPFIPLDLNSKQTTFIFKGVEKTDTLSIAYTTRLERGSQGFCVLIDEEEIAYTTFNVQCYDFERFNNSCADYYEIKVVY